MDTCAYRGGGGSDLSSLRWRSATHRALECPDVLWQIFEHAVSPDEDEVLYLRRQFLASLALVSKTLNRTANKALWSRLDSFNPLMTLFSSRSLRPLDEEEGFHSGRQVST